MGDGESLGGLLGGFLPGDGSVSSVLVPAACVLFLAGQNGPTPWLAIGLGVVGLLAVVGVASWTDDASGRARTAVEWGGGAVFVLVAGVGAYYLVLAPTRRPEFTLPQILGFTLGLFVAHVLVRVVGVARSRVGSSVE